MSIEFRIEGLDEVSRKLQALGNPRKARSIARKAARQAMNVVRDAARQNAKAIDDPKTAEKIWKNIFYQQEKNTTGSPGAMSETEKMPST